MVTCDISKECKIAVSTAQNTASAHKAQHTLSQISNNSYPEAQKALRNLLSKRIKWGTTCENIHKGAKWECEIETGDVLCNNCQPKFSCQKKETPGSIHFPAISGGDKRWVVHWNTLIPYSYFKEGEWKTHRYYLFYAFPTIKQNVKKSYYSNFNLNTTCVNDISIVSSHEITWKNSWM